MKPIIAAALITILSLLPGCVTTMEDCCTCLVQNDGIECTKPEDECVAGCFELCEPTRACYCSNAERVGCEEECGCTR